MAFQDDQIIKINSLTIDLLKNQILINKKMFFLNQSIKMGWNYETTKFQIEDIHKRIVSGDKTLNNYSNDLKKAYCDYLIFLNINLQNEKILG